MKRTAKQFRGTHEYKREKNSWMKIMLIGTVAPDVCLGQQAWQARKQACNLNLDLFPLAAVKREREPTGSGHTPKRERKRVGVCNPGEREGSKWKKDLGGRGRRVPKNFLSFPKGERAFLSYTKMGALGPKCHHWTR